MKCANEAVDQQNKSCTPALFPSSTIHTRQLFFGLKLTELREKGTNKNIYSLLFIIEYVLFY